MPSMPRGTPIIALLLLSGIAVAEPAAKRRATTAARPAAVSRMRASQVTRPAPRGRVLSSAETRRFMAEVIRRERNFYQPGVAYDAATGLTFDGHPIDPTSGKLVGGARIWSAASKESLHIILLLKAIEGDETAQALLTPDAKNPSAAVPRALEVLERKIASYQKFDREHPGYGGFLPWYKIDQGKVTPTNDWTDRVPGLDNGQLAWSLYRASDALRRTGHAALADKYAAHLELMKKNVVAIFYDPKEKKLRAEAKLEAGNGRPPAENRYSNNVAGYFLDDPYEGLMLGHFADLFGDWRAHPEGKDVIWKEPRRKPVTHETQGRKVTVAEGHWFSSHEDWGFLVLPFRDVPVADRLFLNAQKARTTYSADRGWQGLFASTTLPLQSGRLDPRYLSALGVKGVNKQPISQRMVFTPYATFSLALADKQVFASWLKRMLSTPRVWTEYGIGESYSHEGERVAPLLTWDGKALPLIGWMGGIAGDLREQMKRDGVYDAFLGRVKADYARFEGAPIEGDDVPLAPPAARGAAVQK
jgi:hypothetical protein